jgi:hypothetical protein
MEVFSSLEVLVLAQRFAIEGTGVQIQHAGGLGLEVQIADEDPGPVLPGLDRVGLEPAAHGGGGRRDGPGGHLAGQFRARPA